MSVLSDSELEKLMKILWRWNPRLIAVLQQSSITVDQREDLRGALAEELVSRGLNRDSEPNMYGLEIESLIDKVGHIPETTSHSHD